MRKLVLSIIIVAMAAVSVNAQTKKVSILGDSRAICDQLVEAIKNT